MSKDAEDPVLVTSAPNEMEAGIIVGALESAGIKATMSGVYTAGFRAEAPGWVQILVNPEDFERAKQIVVEARGAGDETDWSNVDVGEPEDT